jgi:xanthine dehydrogenase accessory factor
VLVTLFSLNSNAMQPGTCLFSTEENYSGSVADAQIEKIIKQDIGEVFANNHSAMKNYLQSDGQIVTGFIELVKLPVELIIAGAGNDAFPLVQMANVLGWHVTVVDGRKTHANTNRFPSAKNIIVAKPAEAIKQIAINEQTVFVLMSHNYNYDLAMLKELVNTNCNYVGVLGPKKKLDKMYVALQDDGIEINDEAKEKVYGPVGLDIGAETAEEIALSVMAEIKTVLAKKDAATLRKKDGFIHEHHITANLTVE